MSESKPLYLAIDIGTGSVRAGLFTEDGKKVSYNSADISTRNPRVDYYEQSTDDIWRSTVQCIRAVVSDARRLQDAQSWHIASIGVDATCSLAVCHDDAALSPISLEDSGEEDNNDNEKDVYNVMLWLDRRSVEDAKFINDLAENENNSVKNVLRHFGGVISPENEPPKVRWLFRHRLQNYRHKNVLLLDLADWLVAKLTGAACVSVRSTCTLACKWGWHNGWDPSFWEALGLSHLCDRDFRAIGNGAQALHPGAPVANIDNTIANECDIIQEINCVIASPLIDAYAGSVWMLSIDSKPVENIVSFVCGTSTCMLHISPRPEFVHGVWGPFLHALLRGWHVLEGGQSVTGKLLQHVVRTHPSYHELRKRDDDDNDDEVNAIILKLCLSLSSNIGDHEDPTTHVHVLDHHAGNRTPLANPSLRGVYTGLSLAKDIDDLSVRLRATIQALCYGARRIIDVMSDKGMSEVKAIAACGGLCKNQVFLTELADAMGIPIILSKEQDTVLLGAAVIARMAHIKSSDMIAVAKQLCQVGETLKPNLSRKGFHDRKYQVYRKMYEHDLEYRNIMDEH